MDAMYIRDNVFTVVDVETTGGSHRENRVIEIGAVKIQNGKMIDTFHTLVHPQRRIPFFITWMTGISNHMVHKSPKFLEVADEFWAFLKGGIFVAHNVNFDFDFLKREFLDVAFPSLNHTRICTIKLARRIFPGFTHYNLPDLSKNLGIPKGRSHRALDDALATAKILLLMFERLEDHGIKTLQDLERIYQLSPEECRGFFEKRPLQQVPSRV